LKLSKWYNGSIASLTNNTMNITIKGTHVEITEAMREYVEKRLKGISKFVSGEETVVAVELEKTTNHHRQGNIFSAEIKISRGAKLYAKSEKSDIYAAIDDVRDEVMNILASEKDKKISKTRKLSQKVKKLIKE